MITEVDGGQSASVPSGIGGDPGLSSGEQMSPGALTSSQPLLGDATGLASNDNDLASNDSGLCGIGDGLASNDNVSSDTAGDGLAGGVTGDSAPGTDTTLNATQPSNAVDGADIQMAGASTGKQPEDYTWAEYNKMAARLKTMQARLNTLDHEIKELVRMNLVMVRQSYRTGGKGAALASLILIAKARSKRSALAANIEKLQREMAEYKRNIPTAEELLDQRCYPRPDAR